MHVSISFFSLKFIFWFEFPPLSTLKFVWILQKQHYRLKSQHKLNCVPIQNSIIYQTKNQNKANKLKSTLLNMFNALNITSSPSYSSPSFSHLLFVIVAVDGSFSYSVCKCNKFCCCFRCITCGIESANKAELHWLVINFHE